MAMNRDIPKVETGYIYYHSPYPRVSDVMDMVDRILQENGCTDTNWLDPGLRHFKITIAVEEL